MVTFDEFVKRANKKHNNKYDYSKVSFKRLDNKVCIICPMHGEFWQQANNHLNGQGCPRCSGKGRTQEDIVEEFKNIHGDKYDYSKVNYERIDKKVCIICPIHGEFWQEPRLHIKGCGCKYCAGKEMNTEEFIRRAKLKHKDKYDYSKVNFVNSQTNVCIICPEHGEFLQQPNNHLQGNGCPKCGYITVHNKRKFGNDTFIEMGHKVHGGKYDYSKSEYYNTDTNVCIICPIHGEFWQTPYKHINCKRGCPKCRTSHMENEIRNLLIENDIEFEEQKRFSWLGLQSLDFYLPKQNMAIECQGKQHFEPTKYWGGEETLTKINERDKRKKERCDEHDIKIIYYEDKDLYFPYEVYKDTKEIIREINNVE